MELSAFEDLLDRHGGTLEAWPADATRDAAALLDLSAEARAALGAMRQVEAELRRPGGGLTEADSVAAIAMRHRQEARVHRVARRAGWATAAALLLAMGLALGHMWVGEHEDTPDHAMALALDISGPVDVD